MVLRLLLVCTLAIASSGCGNTGPSTDDGATNADLAQVDLAHVSCSVDSDCPKTAGGATQQCCNNVCIDTAADPMHCGACGKSCPTPANGSAACVAGVCGIASCTSTWGDCDKDPSNGCEKTLDNDLQNCGACGNACPSGANARTVCMSSKCSLQCAAGFADCDGSSTNGCETPTDSDASNCGGCGKACGTLPNANVACVTGACAIISCNAGYSDCDGNPANGCEVGKLSDASNCGACGKVCSFANAAATCTSGTCVLGACNPGFANCDGNPNNGCETPTSSDARNCGACGKICTAANGASACVNGACVVASCNSGYADCDGDVTNGCESQPQSDFNNCGGCGKACPSPANTTVTCTNGTCGVGSCKFGFADCNNNSSDGCEANLLSPNSCGTCTTVCSALPNAAPGCNAGMCGLGTCNSLYGNCDNNAANGCERPLGADLNNCGACGKVCSPQNASGLCLNGLCGISSCFAGYTDCDMSATNGCESYTAADPMNCGGCGKVCPSAPNSTPTCSSSTCGLACATGYGNCDASGGNGCEINLRTDVTNCGTCGKLCAAIANGTPGCNSGTCGISACNAGYADCNNFASDGCEINTLTDKNNCGGCGKLCNPPNAVGLCLNGQCGIASCNAGYSDCDGNPANGCEALIAGDAKNCGGCGKVCPSANNATPVCSSSTCGLTCVTGYANCDGSMTNGCEINLTNDINNCGTCSKVCPVPANASQACLSGACRIGSCNTGYGDCNGVVSDGCETPLLTNISNCGTCGRTCSFANANNSCLNGTCGFSSCKTNYADCNNTQSDGCEVNMLTDANNCGGCGIKCTAGTPYCQSGTCSSNPCRAASGRAIAGPYRTAGFCFYLGNRGATCDQVCADLGGQNLAASAFTALTDGCNGPLSTSPITWFYNNGNACNFSASGGGAPGTKTLGHGYDTAGATTTGYYDKCSTVTSAGSGTFPGDLNGNSYRCDVCACF